MYHQGLIKRWCGGDGDDDLLAAAVASTYSVYSVLLGGLSVLYIN